MTIGVCYDNRFVESANTKLLIRPSLPDLKHLNPRDCPLAFIPPKATLYIALILKITEIKQSRAVYF